MNFDRTFCASKGCINECGRQMTQEEKNYWSEYLSYMPVSFAYFCGDLENGSISTIFSS
jgi:hypothetical protein